MGYRIVYIRMLAKLMAVCEAAAAHTLINNVRHGKSPRDLGYRTSVYSRLTLSNSGVLI